MRHGGDRVFKMRELPKDYSDKTEGKADESDTIESGVYRRDEGKTTYVGLHVQFQFGWFVSCSFSY